MEAISLLPSSCAIAKFQNFSIKTQFYRPAKNLKFLSSLTNYTLSTLSYLPLRVSPSAITRASPTSTSTPSTSFTSSLTPSKNHHWMVIMDKPPEGINSKSEIVDYYVKTLAKVIGRCVCFVFRYICLFFFWF